LQIGLGSTVAFNLSPAVVAGPAWFIGAHFSNISFALEGRTLFAPAVQVSGVSVVPSVVMGSTSARIHHRAFFGCGRFEFGALNVASATNFKVDPGRSSIIGAGPRIGAEWHFADHVALRGSADLMILATPTKLQRSGNQNILWTSGQISPSLAVGLVASF
jgi:hypothetical protein